VHRVDSAALGRGRAQLPASHRSNVAPCIVCSDRTSSACPQLITTVCATAAATRCYQRCLESEYVPVVRSTPNLREEETP